MTTLIYNHLLVPYIDQSIKLLLVEQKKITNLQRSVESNGSRIWSPFWSILRLWRGSGGGPVRSRRWWRTTRGRRARVPTRLLRDLGHLGLQLPHVTMKFSHLKAESDSKTSLLLYNDKCCGSGLIKNQLKIIIK